MTGRMEAWLDMVEYALERGERVPDPPSTTPLLVLAAAFWLVHAGALAYHTLFLDVRGIPAYVVLGITLSGAASTAALGCAFWWFRDIKRWRSLAVLQILIGCALGTAAIFNYVISNYDPPIMTSLIVLGAAVTVANGCDKFSKLCTESAEVRS